MHRAFPGDFIVLQHEKFDSLTEIRNNMEIIHSNKTEYPDIKTHNKVF